MAGNLFGRSVAALVLAGGLVMMTGAPAYAVDDQNCDDFATQTDAQAHFNADPSDPDRLDANDNGQACEEFGYSGSSSGSGGATDSAIPAGGTSTGFGGMADELAPKGQDDRRILVGGGALALVGIGWTATRRRRHT